MFQDMFAQGMAQMSGNVIREILKLTQQPNIISFAGGLPSAEAFPTQELQEIAVEVMSRQGAQLLQYGTSEGYLPLREYIAQWVKEKGIEATPEEVLIVSGSQQGIELVGKTFLNPGEGVLVENPTYLAALQIFGTYQAKFNIVESDEAGLLPDSFRKKAAATQNKLGYVVPTFQNPTGITLTLERRKELTQIIAQSGLVLVEDDPYGDLRYSGEALPAIKAFDTTNQVIYLGSFSKIISPGLRVGFAIGPQEVLRKMVIGKQTSDVHTSNLSQALVYEFCKRGSLKRHIAATITQYREKRDLMLKLLAAYFPAEVTWTKPEGGLFLWLTLPEGASATELLKEAVAEKVAFIPGDSFFPGGGGSNTMRLNFSNATKEDIEVGIQRLGKVVAKYLEKKR